MKKENIEKVTEAIMDEYDMSHKVAYYFAEITVGGLEKGMAKFPAMFIEKMLRGEENE